MAVRTFKILIESEEMADLLHNACTAIAQGIIPEKQSSCYHRARFFILICLFWKSLPPLLEELSGRVGGDGIGSNKETIRKMWRMRSCQFFGNR